MNTWTIDREEILGIAPLEELLGSLGFALACQGEKQRLLLVVGDSGTGKTIGCRVFADGCERPIVYLRVPPREVLTPRNLLQLIATPAGVSSDLHTRHELASRIIEESLERPHIFVLDDAQSMAQHQLLDVLRYLHDGGGHVFILAGMGRLEHAFHEHREFSSRVALRHQTRIPTVEEIAPIFPDFSDEGIAAIHLQTGGRMRQVMALSRRLQNLMDRRKLLAPELTAQQIQAVSSHFLMRAH